MGERIGDKITRVLGWAQKKFLTSQSQVNMLITQIHSLIFAIQMLAF